MSEKMQCPKCGCTIEVHLWRQKTEQGITSEWLENRCHCGYSINTKTLDAKEGEPK